MFSKSIVHWNRNLEWLHLHTWQLSWLSQTKPQVLAVILLKVFYIGQAPFQSSFLNYTSVVWDRFELHVFFLIYKKNVALVDVLHSCPGKLYTLTIPFDYEFLQFLSWNIGRDGNQLLIHKISVFLNHVYIFNFNN